MKILVTGGSGFIGRYLASHAVKLGHEVVATYLSAPELSSRITTDPTIVWRPLDMRDVNAVRKSVEETRPDAVFHLAAQAYAQRAWSDPAETFETNVIGTIHLYEALRRNPPREGVLLTASASAYGIPASLPIREEAPLWATNPYGVSKACQETVSFQYARNFGLRIVRARLFGTTGPGKTGDALNDFARQVARCEDGSASRELRVGNLETRRDISDIRDVVRALWRVFEAGDPDQPINVGAGESYSVRWIVDRLLGLSKVPLRVTVDPKLLRPTDELDNRSDITRLRALGHTREFPLERTISDALDFWRGDTAASPSSRSAARRSGRRHTSKPAATKSHYRRRAGTDTGADRPPPRVHRAGGARPHR